MATITQRLAFLISANADGAIKAFDKTAQQAEKQLGKAQKSIDRLGANMTRFGAAGLAAAGTLGAGLFRLAQGAIEDQKAQALLAEQLRTSTGATNAQIAAIEKNIDAMARATGVADDQLRPALGNLVRATGDTTKAQQLLQTSLDISAATGRDLEAVTLAISRAATGNIGALSRLGIPLDENVKKSKDFEAALAALNDQFGGAAAVAADTYAGKMARAQVAISEAGESIGSAFIPVIETASKVITNGIGAFDSFNQTTGGLAGKLATIGTVGLGAVSAMSVLGGQAIKLSKNFLQVDADTGKLTRSLTALGKGSIIATGLIAGAAIVYQSYANKKQQAEERTRSLAEALELEGQAQRDALTELVANDKRTKEYATTLNNLGLTFTDVEKAANGQASAFTKIRAEFDKYISRGQFTQDRARQLGEAIGFQGEMSVGAANQIGALIGEVDRLTTANLNNADSAAVATQAIGAMGNATGAEGKTLVEQFKERSRIYFQRLRNERLIEEGQKKLTEGAKASSKATNADTEATKKNTEAKQKFAAKVEDAASALRTTLNDALEASKQKLVDATEAYNSYMTGISSAISGTINFGNAQSTATANAEALTSAQQAVTKAQQEYNDALKGSDTDRIAETYKTLTEAQDTFAKASQKPTGFLAVLQDQGRAAARFGDNLDKLLASNLDQVAIDQIAGLGAEVGNQVAEELLSGADPAGKIAEVNRLIKSTQDIADRVGKAAASKFKQAGVDQAVALTTGVQQVFDEWYPKLDEKNLAGVVDPLKTIAGWADTVKTKLADIGAGAAPAAATVASAPMQVSVTPPEAGDWAGLSGDQVRDIASWLGGFPSLAEGGIVKARNGGTFVRVGEGGRDEAVIPLPTNGAMGGTAPVFNITVQAGLGADGTQIGKEIVDVLVQYQRRVGALPLKVV